MRLLFDRDLNALGNREFNGMRIAQGKNNDLALEFSAITDAHDIEVLLKAFGNAANGVGHQGPRQAVQRAMILGVPESVQDSVLLLEADAPGHHDT